MKKAGESRLFCCQGQRCVIQWRHTNSGEDSMMTPQTFPEVKQFFPKTHTLISRLFPKDDASRLMDVFAYRHHNRRFEVFHVVEMQLERCSAIELQALTSQVELWRHNILDAPECSDSYNGPLHQEILHHFIISTICQDM